jgi:hypothetical protein
MRRAEAGSSGRRRAAARPPPCRPRRQSARRRRARPARPPPPRRRRRRRRLLPALLRRRRRAGWLHRRLARSRGRAGRPRCARRARLPCRRPRHAAPHRVQLLHVPSERLRAPRRLLAPSGWRERNGLVVVRAHIVGGESGGPGEGGRTKKWVVGRVQGALHDRAAPSLCLSGGADPDRQRLPQRPPCLSGDTAPDRQDPVCRELCLSGQKKIAKTL